MNGGGKRHYPVHYSHRGTRFIPSEEACDTTIPIHQRVHFAVGCIQVSLEFDIFHACDPLGCAHQTRINFA